MEDLVLKCSTGDEEIRFESFDSDNELGIDVIDITNIKEPYFFYLTPDQVRSLIAHLTNCLKEVENG